MNFGILGLDHWYTAFLACDILSKSSLHSLTAIAATRPTHTQWARETYPDVPLMDSAEGLLTDPSLECILICAPTSDAEDYAIQALNAGKHVLAVKPTSNTLAGMQKIVDAAAASQCFYGSFEGLQRLHTKSLRLKEIIDSGVLGNVLSVHQVGNGALPAPWPGAASGDPSWWINPRCIQTGAWMDHAIYAIDLLRFAFTGVVESISGHIGNRSHPDLGLEDYGIALLRLQTSNGLISVVLENTWAAKDGAGVHWMRIVGSDGWLRSEGDSWILTSNGKETTYNWQDEPFFSLDAFANLLTHQGHIPFSAHDAIENVRICHRFYASALKDSLVCDTAGQAG